jgi:hypothetical protein
MRKKRSPVRNAPSVIIRLSPGDLEKARLVLRGGSVLDWRRLRVTSIEECDAILRVNGFRPEEPEDSSRLRSIHLLAVDIPIRLDEAQLKIWAPGLELESRIVHVLAEFQIVDQASNIKNEQGDASHEMYRERRLARVRERLLNGKMDWSGKNSG